MMHITLCTLLYEEEAKQLAQLFPHPNANLNINEEGLAPKAWPVRS